MTATRKTRGAVYYFWCALTLLVFLSFFVSITDPVLSWFVGIPGKQKLTVTAGVIKEVGEKCIGSMKLHYSFGFTIDAQGGKKNFSLSCGHDDQLMLALQRDIGQPVVVLSRKPPSLFPFWRSEEIWDLKTASSHLIKYEKQAATHDEHAGGTALMNIVIASLAIWALWFITGGFKEWE